MIQLVNKTMTLEERQEWFDKIMSRLMSLYGITKLTHLAKHFDFDKDTPKKMRFRGEIPFGWVIAAVRQLNDDGRGVSLDWLLNGVEVTQINTEDLQAVKIGLQKGMAKLAMANHVPKIFIDNAPYNSACSDLVLRDINEELQRKLSVNTDKKA